MPCFANEQIVFALRQAENDATVDEVCRKMSLSKPKFYPWKKQCIGMGVPEIHSLKQTEDENGKVKRLVANDTGSLHAAGCPQAKVVRPAARREVAGPLQVAYGISERRACLDTGSGFSSQRHRKRSDLHVALRMPLKVLVAARFRYSYWRLHILLQRKVWKVYHERNYWICRCEGL